MSQTHWTAEDLGVRQNREDLIALLNACRPGSFIAVKEYVDSAGGRVTDKILRVGIRYENIKAASLLTVEAALALTCPDLMAVEVHRTVKQETLLMETRRRYRINAEIWPEAITRLRQFPMASDVRKRPGVPEAVEAALVAIFPVIPRNVIHDTVFFAEALLGVREGIVNPQQRDTGFTKEGQSGYAHEDNDQFYIRDCLVVSSKVSVDEHGRTINEGDYKPRTREQNEVSAIKDAIKDELPIGNYRAFILRGGKYKSFSIDGQLIMQENGDLNRFFFGLPEVKELLEAPKDQVEV
jgi:hypothetical protein